MEGKIGYRSLLTEKNYLKNFSANMINRFGDSIDALAFAWMVYEITGDRTWSAIIFGLNSLPTILLMPFAGVIVEKYDKKLIMVLADLGRAALVAMTATLYATGLIMPWMLAATTFLMSSLEAFRIPAGLGIYPMIVPREKFTVAISLSQSCTSVFMMLGTGAFGFIVAWGGLQAAMLVNAATFVISAAFISRIKLPVRPVDDVKLNVKQFFAQFREGFAYLRQKRIIFMICVIGSLLGVLSMPMESLKAPYISESLKLGELALSIMGICAMGGTMAGTALFPYINRRFSKSRLFVAGGFALSVAYGAYTALSFFGGSAVYVLLGTIALIYGFGSSFMNVVVNVAFVEHIENEYIGRVGSLFNSMAAVLIPPASFFVAAVARVVTVNQIFVIFGVINLALFGYLALNKLLREIDGKKAEKNDIQRV